MCFQMIGEPLQQLNVSNLTLAGEIMPIFMAIIASIINVPRSWILSAFASLFHGGDVKLDDNRK